MGYEDGDDDEKPVHLVMLDDFYIDQYEVTNALYAKCVDVGGCRKPAVTTSDDRGSYYGHPTYADYPVIYVTWEDANNFCKWRGARLPTEAEWEKAARGTDARLYPWGNDEPDCNLANFFGCRGDTTARGQYEAGVSPYGVYDMAGNVWEWVADWYDSGYYAMSPDANPSGLTKGDSKVLRGGSWYFDKSYLRSTDRIHLRPGMITNYIGFRCAKDTP